MAAQELFGTSLFSDGNLVSYYRLESTADSKGSNTLTNNNSVGFNAALFNNGGDLGSSNTNKSLTVATAILGANPTGLTYVGWIKLQSEITSGSWELIQQEATGAGSVNFRMIYDYNGGSQRITFGRQRIGVAFDNNTISTGAFGTSTWHHLAMTYDGSTVTMYFDGGSATTVSSSSANTGNGSPADQFSIGQFQGGGFASAIFDDVAIFSRALSSGEISGIYNGTSNIKTINGLAYASVKTVNGLAIASVKSINGLQ